MKPKLRVSSSVIPFRKKVEKIWKLKRHKYPQDKFKTVVFFGMYHIGDYIKYMTHKGKKIVFWCGSDILNLLATKVSWHLLFEDAEHYVENELEQKELKSLGIKSKIRPSFLEDIDDFPVCFKPTDKLQVYLAAYPEREEEYGVILVCKIAERLPDIIFHIYGIGQYKEIKPISLGTPSSDIVRVPNNVIFHGRVPQEQFNEEIKNYHCGLRPNEHDGFSEILAKSVLMGQYPISRIKYPHIDSYEKEEELIALLKDLKNKKKPNLKGREFWRNNVNKYPWTK